MLTMPEFQIPRPFKSRQFYIACRWMVKEMWSNCSFGCTPEYPYHPAYDLVVEMADMLRERGINPFNYVGMNMHFSHHILCEEEQGDKAMDTILKYWGETHIPNAPANRDIRPSVAPTMPEGGFPTEYGGYIEYYRDFEVENFARVPFTPQDYYRASLEAVAEMQAHGCTDPVPRYTPHPAYDSSMSYVEQLHAVDLDPLEFLKRGLQHGLHWRSEAVEKFKWYLYRRRASKRVLPFNYTRMEALFDREESEYRQTTCEDWLPFNFSDELSPDGLRDYHDDEYEYFSDSSDFASQYSVDDNPDVGRTLNITPPASPIWGMSCWPLRFKMLLHEAAACVGSLELYDPSLLSDEDGGCPFCLEAYVVSTDADFQHVAVKTPCCRQPFGKDCLLTVLLECGRHCPMCRSNIMQIALEPVRAKYDVDFPPLAGR